MINITEQNKSQCCGCNACGDACAKHAITFKTDIEGFWYPEVNKGLCTDCGLCEKACPILQHADKIIRYSEPRVFAAYTKDDGIRTDSTSGGIHSMLAQAMFEKNAYVGGAVYNEDHTVSQIIDDNPERLPQIRSSKYLQSDASGVYKEIKAKLREGREVFFCGCPCQVQALYKFLGNKEYDNLTTCDFICRGVNSPKVFLKYIDMLERQFRSKAKDIKFKNKKWGWHNFSMRVNFENGKEYCKDLHHDLFFIGYLHNGNFARPSCYHCKFKGFPQKADITLADFWGIETIDPSMDQDKGTSLVMINSDKGMALFQEIKDLIIWREFRMNDARRGNSAIDKSLVSLNSNRNVFFEDLNQYPFEKVAAKHFRSPSVFTEIKNKLRPFKQMVKHILMLGLSIENWKTFLYINYISNHIKRDENTFVNIKGRTIIQLEKGSKVRLFANINTGLKQVKNSHSETRILIEKNGQLQVDGEFNVFTNSFIRVTPEGKLILHGGFINENVQITAGSIVEIGSEATIGRDVVIRSYDGHAILKDGYNISEPIYIGNHVWIGQGATILKGVTIGNGAIIASGAVVTNDIPANCIAAGIPAKVIQENVKWE